MTQARSSSTAPASGSMIGNLFKKAQFWKSSQAPTMSNGWIEQTVSLRYLDGDILEKDLDRILGEGCWKHIKVVQGRHIISATRQLSQTELDEIETNAKNHYAKSGEVSAVKDQIKSKS